MSPRASFWPELKRRNVLRASLVWLALSWLVILLVLALGFPVALILARVFEVRPEGVFIRAAETDAQRIFYPTNLSTEIK